MLQPGINIPTSITGTGTLARANGLFSNHIFNGGLEKPQILESLLIKYPQYYLLTLTDKIGASRDLYNNTFNWTVMGRTRESSTVTAVANGTTTSATLTLDTAYDSSADNSGYWLVGDTFYSPDSGARGVVTAVGNSGAFQTITVARPDGTSWSTALINTNFKIGHTGTSFGQGSTGSGGFRTYFPDQDYNIATIGRRGIKVTRNAMKDKIVLDDGTWWFKEEDFEQKEFLRDIEATTIFGTRFKSSTIGGRSQSRGLLEYAEGSGKVVTYSSAIGAQEADIKYLIEQLVPENGSEDIILLCGIKLLSDIQSALGSFYKEIPQTEKPRELAGLNFQSYYFLGKRLHFQYYELFGDTKIVPSVAASSTAKNFDNFGIALDFGTVTGGGRNIEMGYVQRVIQKVITGMGSESMEVSNAFDGVQFELLSEFMPICYMPNRLGLLYANS